MTRKIYIDGKHWDNIMALPCVRGLNKRGEEYVDYGSWHVAASSSFVCNMRYS